MKYFQQLLNHPAMFIIVAIIVGIIILTIVLYTLMKKGKLSFLGIRATTKKEEAAYQINAPVSQSAIGNNNTVHIENKYEGQKQRIIDDINAKAIISEIEKIRQIHPETGDNPLISIAAHPDNNSVQLGKSINEMLIKNNYLNTRLISVQIINEHEKPDVHVGYAEYLGGIVVYVFPFNKKAAQE